MIYVGIDNGVTGSIGAVDSDGSPLLFTKTPTFITTSYTKTVHRMRRRISYPDLWNLFMTLRSENTMKDFKVYLERPMINSARFQASISASAALEVTLVALEAHMLPYEYCDSRAWQKLLLGPAVKGAPALKKASKDIGSRFFPKYKDLHEDMDGLLIAEWARRTHG